MPGELREIESALAELWQNCRIEPSCIGVSLGILRTKRFGEPRPDVAQLMLLLEDQPDDTTVWFTANACWVKTEDGKSIGVDHGPVQ